MAETADKPEPYLADGASKDILTALRLVIDPLVNPEEAGDIDPGMRPGSQELRKERWDRLVAIFTRLRDEYQRNERVFGLEVGYFNGEDEHPIGIAVAIDTHDIVKGTIPESLLQRTQNEELRLVADTVSVMESAHVVGFALPPITSK